MRTSLSSTCCRPAATPDTRSVRGANLCRIAVHRPQDGDTAVVLSVIDNLVKGRCRAGGAEHEHHVRIARNHGARAGRAAAVTHASRPLKRSFGIAAPRMAVRHARAVVLALASHCVAGAGTRAVAWLVYVRHRRAVSRASSSGRGAARASASCERSSTHRRTRSPSCAARSPQHERQLQIERATHGDLATQVKALDGRERAAQGRPGVLPVAHVWHRRARRRRSASTASACSPSRCRANIATSCCSCRSGSGQGIPGQAAVRGRRAARTASKMCSCCRRGARAPAGTTSLSFKFFQRVEGTFSCRPAAG